MKEFLKIYWSRSSFLGIFVGTGLYWAISIGLRTKLEFAVLGYMIYWIILGLINLLETVVVYRRLKDYEKTKEKNRH